MSFYLVAGASASTQAMPVATHLPSARRRRYPSDMTDAEWAILAPLVPAGRSGSAGGRPPTRPRRDIVDAIRYLAHNGCVWRALPADFPPWQTAYDYHSRWSADGTVTRLHTALREQTRVAAGRCRQPSAAIIDSQSVRGAETVARTSRGFDAGKKVNGRKRHIATDTTGLLLAVLVTAASVQDRDAARALRWAVHQCFGRIVLVWADSGYAGQLVRWATHTLHVTVHIVAKLAGQTTFVVLPRRWVVERTLAWITRCRRTVRDYERLPEHHAAFVHWAMIIIMTRRLARHAPPPNPHSPEPVSRQAFRHDRRGVVTGRAAGTSGRVGTDRRSTGGRPAIHSRRDIVDAIRYVAHSGWPDNAHPHSPDPGFQMAL